VVGHGGAGSSLVVVDGGPADGPAVDGPTVDGTRPPPARRTAWRDPVCLVAVALVLVPTLAAIVSALRNPWAPTDDWALLELQVRSVGSADPPLVGAWSRFGWDHPGPWPLYLLAVPYRLVPAEHGLLFAASALNLLAVAGCAVLALRRARLQALVLLAGLALLQWGMGIGELTDPWNPLLPVVPFALYCLVCVELVVGPRPWMVAVVAAAGSFVVQAHIGFTQPVALVAAITAGLAWWRRRAGDDTAAEDDRSDRAPDDPDDRRRRRRAHWRAVWPTVLVLVLAWSPAVVDQVAGQGNVGLIVRWAFGDDLGRPDVNEGSLAAEPATRAAAWLLDPVGLWIGKAEIPHAVGFDLLGAGHRATLLWIPVALGPAVVLARRARADDRWPTLAAAAVAAAGTVAVVAALTTARGLPVAWAFRWAAVAVMLVWVAAGWSVAGVVDAWSSAGHRRHRAVRAAAIAGLVVLVAATVAATVWRGSLGGQPKQTASGPLLRLVPAIVERTGEEELVVANSEVKLSPVDLGLPVLLERAGIDWVERSDARRGSPHARHRTGRHPGRPDRVGDRHREGRARGPIGQPARR
jgi:hypothetical protein